MTSHAVTEREKISDGLTTPMQRAAADPCPVGGYAGIMASYGTLSVGLAIALRRRRRQVRPLTPFNLVLYALATEHITRVIAKDSVSAPLRCRSPCSRSRPARAR